MENRVAFAPTDAADLSDAVRRLLALLLGQMPTIAKTALGKPFLPDFPDWQISLTHTRGAVACAVFDRPVGIDLERPRPVRMALAERYFTPAERAFATDPNRLLEVWTRKEALLKREGSGIRAPLCTIETIGRADILSGSVEGYLLSVCADPPTHRLIRYPSI